MAAKFARHIAFTAPLLDYVETQVSLGNYTSISDIVRAALRLLKERDESIGVQPLSVITKDVLGRPRADV